jgi:poly(hydroxyalkanoate) depolymerase family esterase
MYLYTPSNVTANPAVVVNVHACHGKGTDVCSTNSAFAQQADKYGFLVVCPSAVSSDGCWDVHSTNVLTHDGGGDATGIISMVKWVIQNKSGDPNRVYVAGHSSGGMMTNVMLGSYPDVFKAGAAYAGVPFACYAQGTVDSLGWNSNCAQGKVTMTAMEWGDLVRAAYPSFAGTRPRIQIWHGTADEVVYFQNFTEEIKQWTNVFGLSGTPTTTENNALQSTWIRTRYADNSGVVQVEAIQETGQPHNMVVDAAEAIHFFGLDGPPSPADAGLRDAAVDARLTGGTDGNRDIGGGGGNGSGGQSGGAGGNRDAGTASGSSGGQVATGSNASGGQTASGGNGGQTAAGGNANGGQSIGSGGRSADAGIDSPIATSGSSGGSVGSGGALGTGGRGSAADAGGAAGSDNPGGRSGGGGTTRVTTAGGSIPSNLGKSGGCSIAGRRGANPDLWIWLVAAFACAARLRRAWRQCSSQFLLGSRTRPMNRMAPVGWSRRK